MGQIWMQIPRFSGSLLDAIQHDVRQRLPALLASEFPEARGRVKLLPNGPPVPYPVQFRVIGPDPAQLRRWADEVKVQVAANANMRGTNDNWNESIKVMRLSVDQDTLLFPRIGRGAGGYI